MEAGTAVTARVPIDFEFGIDMSNWCTAYSFHTLNSGAQAQRRLKNCRIPTPSFSSSILSPVPSVIARPLFIPFHLFSFPLTAHLIKLGGLRMPCKLSQLVSSKMTASCQSWRGPNTLGPQDLQSRGYASHGSHKVVAPMIGRPLLKVGRV